MYFTYKLWYVLVFHGQFWGKLKKSFKKFLRFDNNNEYDNNNFNELFEENGRALNTSFYVNFFLYILKHLLHSWQNFSSIRAFKKVLLFYNTVSFHNFNINKKYFLMDEIIYKHTCKIFGKFLWLSFKFYKMSFKILTSTLWYYNISGF